jgi:UDP-glucose 4-epimerase
MCNLQDLEKVFRLNHIDCVIHFAALKSVSESIETPALYYYNNLNSTTNLLLMMNKYNCNNLIFSSSATVYGDLTPPFKETMKSTVLTNPYGMTKKLIEDILEDNCKYNKSFKTISLRYFNPVGSHKSGLIGEDLDQPANNLMPNILRTLLGKQEVLNIYGTNYDTPDGSCIRDYIHVGDLVEGHMVCMKAFDIGDNYKVYNLGSGTGYSVFELVNGIAKHYGSSPNINKVANRDGDIPVSVSNISKIKEELGWTPTKTLDDICKDSVNYIRVKY